MSACLCPAVCQLLIKLGGSEMFQVSCRVTGQVHYVDLSQPQSLYTYKQPSGGCACLQVSLYSPRPARAGTQLSAWARRCPPTLTFGHQAFPQYQPALMSRDQGLTLERDSSFPSATSRKAPTNLETLNQQPSEARPRGPSLSALLQKGEEPFLRSREQKPEGKESVPSLGSLVPAEGGQGPDRAGNGGKATRVAACRVQHR